VKTTENFAVNSRLPGINPRDPLIRILFLFVLFAPFRGYSFFAFFALFRGYFSCLPRNTADAPAVVRRDPRSAAVLWLDLFEFLFDDFLDAPIFCSI